MYFYKCCKGNGFGTVLLENAANDYLDQDANLIFGEKMDRKRARSIRAAP